MSAATKTLAAATAATAAAAATALAARTVERRWTANDADLGDGADRLLPVGQAATVKTDDGAELAVTVAGPHDGPAVVLAHCWGGGREVWAPVAHRLVKTGHRVVLYDQRGHGSSTVGADGLSIPRLGGDLKAVLEEVNARDAVLAGHSMGGMTIQSMAAHHPEAVEQRARAVVLVATAAAGLSRGVARLDAAAQRVVSHRAVDRALSSPRFGHAMVMSAIGAQARRSDLVITRDFFLALSPEHRAGWLGHMLAMDLREGIATLNVPTTVMVGTRDTLTPPARARQMVEAIPQARLVTLKGRGHMLPLEAADEVAAAIDAHT